MTKTRWWNDAPWNDRRRPYFWGFPMVGVGIGYVGTPLYYLAFVSDFDSSLSEELATPMMQVGIASLLLGLALLVAGWIKHRKARDTRPG
ncbi:MAG: hypothetical protein ACE367_00450 [Acidimicrobiales bacterium]